MTTSATIVKKSVSPEGIELVTVLLRYPKFIHGELMTHRVFSRNASSSRAIPVKRLIDDIVNDPVYPSYWGKNQKGMQAREECTALVKNPYTGEFVSRETAWALARQSQIDWATAFSDAGYHKQIVNRRLETDAHINVVVTSTQWSNFFALRCHPDAQPEIRELAEKIREVINDTPAESLKNGEWHLPFIVKEDENEALELYNNNEYSLDVYFDFLIPISVARCARTSYLTHDGIKPKPSEDIKLYEKLMGQVPLHASPAEHQATPDTKSARNGPGFSLKWDNPDKHGNFTGWIQFRKMLANECQ